MITNYWIEKGISSLLFVLFILLGFLSFGYPLYFDRLFILVLVVLLGTYKVNKDLFSVGVILLLIRFSGEIIFQLSTLPTAKLLYYLIAAIVMYRLRFDKQVRFLAFPVLFLCILTEIYWVVTGYESPRIHSYIAILAMNCVIRYLLVFRVHLIREKWKTEVSSIKLDYSLYKLSGVYGVVVSLMAIEYIIRHNTPLNPLYIYDAYSYASQAISLCVLYLLSISLINLRNKFAA